MSELDGYYVYYGTSPDSLDKVLYVQDPYQTTLAVTQLEYRTYYFSVSAVDTGGLEGPKSNIVSKNPA